MSEEEEALAGKVAALVSPGVLAAAGAEARETHMSFVFLTQDRVFKLKKPVRAARLDFTTLAARERFCRIELELNRRLAPNVYLDVLPLTRGPDGILRVAGAGCVVDWLVEMVRLPDDRMLDNTILAGRVTRAQIDALADVLARFFAAAPRAAASPEDHVARFSEEQAANRALLLRFACDIPTIAHVVDACDRTLVEATPDLLARAREGYVVDGHGDLRPEHVCLIEPPCVIDCLEFSPILRAVDPYEEIDFLGLECEMLGAGWIGPLLHGRLVEAGIVEPPERLLRLYRGFRALVRSRLALAHLLEPRIRLPKKWLPLASRYVEAAARAFEG